MKNPLENLHYALGLGVVLAIIVFLLRGHYVLLGDVAFWAFLFRYVHVFFGILWIGLLYYFNFVQIPSMPKIPDEQKPAISKVIAPAALFFFRWAAAATVLFGLLTAGSNGYLGAALTLQPPVATIGIGMWLALIMAINVWAIIWPNQKKVLGLVPADADAKKSAGRIAMLASRTNTMLSIPMLYCMVAQQNIG
ncbi:MAG: hypothetical protein QOK29_3108 [Rhodospirillaceae bacterium]|jgi:uncharacterized membrane protein|nr:hypothetical protein [Rhodospirillaceae bacterium]